MQSDLERLNELDIREMKKEELMSFLYQYINTGEYIERYSSSVSERLKRNRQLHMNELAELNRKYDEFYFNHLSIYESKAKERLSGKNKAKNKSTTLKALSISLKILIVLFLLYFAVEITASFIGVLVIGIILIILFFVFPIIAIIPMAFVGVLGVLYKIIASIFGVISPTIMGSYNKYVLNKARKKDILTAGKKGITKENIKEIFKFKQIKEDIDYKYNELERKIKLWNFDERNEIQTKHQYLDEKLPLDNRKLEYAIYMYNQLQIGANDNWKEAINDLKLEIRHGELKNELKKISSQIEKSNKSLYEMNRNIDRQFAGLDRMISFETDRMDSRFDGIYSHLDSFYY